MTKEKIAEPATSGEEQPEFGIQRVYIKDISFETPLSPGIFQNEWKPEMNLDIHTNATKIQENLHEVELTLTVTVKSQDKTAFLVEVKQAGLFNIKGFNQEQHKHMLGSYCPNILFPYAREMVTNLVGRGGFPQLYLAPINFDAIYAQHMQEEAKKAEAN